MTPSQQIADLKKQIKKEKENQKCIEIRELRNELDELKGKRKKRFKIRLPTTSKTILIVLFLNFIAVEVFSMWAMIRLYDLSALTTLISCVIGEVLAFLIYSAKSTKENSAGGIVYDMAMREFENKNNNTADENAVG